MGFAGEADLRTDEPGDVGVEVGLAELGVGGRGEGDGEGDLVLVAVVHQRTEGKALRGRELQGAGGEALGERPLNGRGLAGVAGVDPVDVPVLLDGEDEADGLSAAGSDLRGERGELGGKVLGFDGTGAAVADFCDLRVKRRARLDAEQRKQQEKAEESDPLLPACATESHDDHCRRRWRV